MIQHMADNVEHIYLALGYTDFRRQITGLTAMVALNFKMDPYSGNTLFLFCNKKAIKYTLNHREYFTNFLLDGRIPISNNLSLSSALENPQDLVKAA